MLPPVFDHDLSLFQRVEDFAIQQFISQLSVEAFTIAILPRTSWLDVSSLGPDSGDPFSKCNGDKLRTIV